MLWLVLNTIVYSKVKCERFAFWAFVNVYIFLGCCLAARLENVNTNWSCELFMVWLRIFAIVVTVSATRCAYAMHSPTKCGVENMKYSDLVVWFSSFGFSFVGKILSHRQFKPSPNKPRKHHVIFKSNTLFHFVSHKYHHVNIRILIIWGFVRRLCVYTVNLLFCLNCSISKSQYFVTGEPNDNDSHSRVMNIVICRCASRERITHV